MSKIFLAKYRGDCPQCEDPILPGQRVVFVDDELVHTVCRVADICDKCFLTRPCGCGDD